ncbi:uncharacterized protein DUF1579 [Chitinophaga niastensis]|uniref:Uncharacterized protein DUF1579 n=1 Tax=Chitinophaga niastensis TaxID=536980 RepID=A0A2P8HVP0_CHINA|nr:DUF1579 family protein [Chitinophaga niastensis]PSL50301.1 uncharacterized protein DUF1579 [Chitinophaga niastensis]
MRYKYFLLPAILCLLSCGTIFAQEKKDPYLDITAATGPEYDWLKPLAGNYEVEMRIWPKAGADPIPLGTFRVTRKFIGNFLQEIMEPLPGTKTDPFSRITYLSFNKINLRWEYIVMDTRFPVMMFETSFDGKIVNGKELTTYLSSFPVPALVGKEAAGQMAKQRRTFTIVGPDQDEMRQYWTLPSGKEYLAIAYVYKRISH